MAREGLQQDSNSGSKAVISRYLSRSKNWPDYIDGGRILLGGHGPPNSETQFAKDKLDQNAPINVLISYARAVIFCSLWPAYHGFRTVHRRRVMVELTCISSHVVSSDVDAQTDPLRL